MEDKKTSSNCCSRSQEVCSGDGNGDGPVKLPGFRFHPTDEELVGFYLKRKVEKQPILRSVEMIIKQIDIYKHDPWDLTKESTSVREKEWYFYCKRGRKYRNSIRPNRVTGSGFWKATGIDRPIYSNGGDGHQCIGLKKSLVYYRGSAGKGTKTDWMMHEFRLPTDLQHQPTNPNKDTALEAEIWTLCRILKRSKRHIPDWRELSAKRNTMNASSKTNSIDSNENHQRYISFATHPGALTNNSHSNIISDHNNAVIGNIQSINNNNLISEQNSFCFQVDNQNQQQWSTVAQTPSSYSSSLNLAVDDENEMQSFAYYEQIQNSWDDLNSVIEFVVRTPLA